MAQRNTDQKLKNLTKEMEDFKTKLHRLPEMEKTMDYLAQGLPLALAQLEKTLRELQSTETSKISKEKGLFDAPYNSPIIKLPPYSNLGVEGPNTMKFNGRIRSKEVTILIKPRASVNFLSTKLVEDLQLKVQATTRYMVAMKRNVTESSGICKGLTLEMEGLKIVDDFLPFRLADHVDIILGMKWLKTLRKIDIDWGDLALQFIKEDTLIFLKADRNL